MSSPQTPFGEGWHRKLGPPLQHPAEAPHWESGIDAAGRPGQLPGGDEEWWNRFESAAVPPVPPRRHRRWLLIAGAATAAALATTVVLWMPTGSDSDSATSPDPADTAVTSDPELLAEVPAGIPTDSCQPHSEDAAQSGLVCGGSGVRGEPVRVTLRRVETESGLNALFDDVLGETRVVVCPGNIQSPGPWRRNASPQVAAGTLMCGYQDGIPVVAWTDEARLLLMVVEGDEGSDALPSLYRWWSSHS